MSLIFLFFFLAVDTLIIQFVILLFLFISLKNIVENSADNVESYFFLKNYVINTWF